MHVDWQSNEVYLGPQEWVTVILPDSTEITIKGDGTGFTDSGTELPVPWRAIMKITTNNVPRDLIDGFALTAKEREDFDWIDWPAIDEGTDSATFFRYKGELYSLDQFERAQATPGWDGIMGISWSFAYLVRLVGNDQVVVGTVMA